MQQSCAVLSYLAHWELHILASFFNGYSSHDRISVIWGEMTFYHILITFDPFDLHWDRISTFGDDLGLM